MDNLYWLNKNETKEEKVVVILTTIHYPKTVKVKNNIYILDYLKTILEYLKNYMRYIKINTSIYKIK